jgi:DNA-binding MarR family transcriptional regulator
MRSALGVLLGMIEADPGIAKLCLIDAQAAGARVQRRRGELLAELATVVDRGRSRGSASTAASQLTAEGVVGAVVTVLQTRLTTPASEPLNGLLGPLMSMIVLPYRGPAAGRRQLSMPAAKALAPSRVARPQATDALQGLNMRLTYRTGRVLTVIAEHPGASNRKVADISGIADQGQVSKLLSRLMRLGLAENIGGGHGRGAANAWRLTPRGELLQQAGRPLR